MIPQEADQTHIEYGFPVVRVASLEYVRVYHWHQSTLVTKPCDSRVTWPQSYRCVPIQAPVVSVGDMETAGYGILFTTQASNMNSLV